MMTEKTDNRLSIALVVVASLAIGFSGGVLTMAAYSRIDESFVERCVRRVDAVSRLDRDARKSFDAVRTACPAEETRWRVVNAVSEASRDRITP